MNTFSPPLFSSPTFVAAKELHSGLLECTLREQQTLDTGQTLVGVVVRLLDQGEFLTLRLVETAFDEVRLFQLLESEDEQLGIVLVRQQPGRNSEFETTR